MIEVVGAIVVLSILWDSGPAWAPFVGLFAGFLVFLYQRMTDRRSRELALSYLVTTQRIIFVTNWRTGAEFRWVWFQYLQHSPSVKVNETGVGTVTYGSAWGRSRVRANELRGAWAPPVLELRAIPDARRVADLIEQARNRLIATYTRSP
ncbi:hypothetical protein [Amycolatopsis speibonae]|uniref:DUF304 domain-containing protein n=1 Tax=Amycolatopsis speibonae TaxID=1450224 RepID=A0ABV7P8I5_9PSEU